MNERAPPLNWPARQSKTSSASRLLLPSSSTFIFCSKAGFCKLLLIVGTRQNRAFALCPIADVRNLLHCDWDWGSGL